MHRDEPEALFVDTVFEWRAKLLIEQGATANAIAVLKQGLDVCYEDLGRERLLKALQKAERPTAPRRKKPEVIERPATGHNASRTVDRNSGP